VAETKTTLEHYSVRVEVESALFVRCLDNLVESLATTEQKRRIGVLN
jgi:hypothetical protein